MTTKCPSCGHEFHNVTLRRDCPRCGQPLQASAASQMPTSTREDDGFDATGFAVGIATGIPLSPTRGISIGSMLGAALHSDPTHAAPAADPAPSNGNSSSSSYDSSSSSSSYDSSSSSSSDSGGSSGGGGE